MNNEYRLLLVILEEEVIIWVSFDVYRLNALVHERPKCVNIVLLFCRNEDTILAEPRHPGLLEVLQRIVFSGHRREVIFFFGRIGKIVDFVEDNNRLKLFGVLCSLV